MTGHECVETVSGDSVIGQLDDHHIRSGERRPGRLHGRRVDERQPRSRFGGDERDLAGREVEVDRHRCGLPQGGGGVDHECRRSIAGDDEQSAVVSQIERTDRLRQSHRGVGDLRPRRRTVDVRPDGVAVGFSLGALQQGHLDRGHRARTEHALMPGAPYTCVNAVLGTFGTWRSPARPCSCRTHSIT